MDSKKHFQEIEPFIKKLNQHFAPTKIILFGSRARGERWENSDYDFIIVSSAFEGVHWLKRIEAIVELWDLLCDIDILPYTPEEFKKKRRQIGTVREAVKEGIILN
jgi:hypothetical protein